MIYPDIAKKIMELKNADLDFRDRLIEKKQLGQGYNEEMAILHNRNAGILNGIIATIGYPTVDKVGKQATEAAWLVIQHSIGNPDFMRKCVKLLEVAVSENKADPKNLAYLTDRVAALEGNKQLYGTQFDWDESGELSPKPYDDLNKVIKEENLSDLIHLKNRRILLESRPKQKILHHLLI